MMHPEKENQRSPILREEGRHAGHGLVHQRLVISCILVTVFAILISVAITVTFTFCATSNRRQIADLIERVNFLDAKFHQLAEQTDWFQDEEELVDVTHIDGTGEARPADLRSVYPEGILEQQRIIERMRREAPAESGTTEKPRRRKSKKKRRRQKGDSKNKRASFVDAIHFEATIPSYNKSALVTHEDRLEIYGKDGFISKAGFHPKVKTYKFWEPVSLGGQTGAEFVHISRDNNHFTIERNGIYFIYAQVLFHDLSGRWAFGIYVNDNIRAQCTTSQHVNNDYIEGLTDSHRASHGVYMHCYTGVVVHVERRERVSIRSLYDGRTVVALGRSTFWGMVKLKDLGEQS